MVEVPGVGGESPVDRVHDRVFNDVHRARHATREEALCPARESISLHQKASGEKPVVCSHLPIHNILCENMGAEWVWVPLPESRDNMVPCALDVCVTAEILDHSSLAVTQDGLNPEPRGPLL